MSTHNLCFRAKIRKKIIPLYTPVFFFYIKVGCKGVYISRACLHDALQTSYAILFPAFSSLTQGKFCIKAEYGKPESVF